MVAQKPGGGAQLKAGSPVTLVVSRGTWMAKELNRLGGGGLTADPADPVSLADATYRLCANIGRYRAEANRARERWRAFNTPENLVELFESW